MPWFLKIPPDFYRRYDEAAAVWRSCREGRRSHVQMSVSGSIGKLVGDPAINDIGRAFDGFFTHPEARFRWRPPRMFAGSRRQARCALEPPRFPFARCHFTTGWSVGAETHQAG